MFRVKGLILFAAAAATGCAGSMGTMRPYPPTAASELQAKPITAFDGQYQNTIRISGSFGGGNDVHRWCETPGQPIITIARGSFTYAVPHPNVPGDATPVFTAIVAENGVFSGSVNAGTMSGRIRGSVIEGRIDGSGCLYDFNGQRI